MPKIPNVYYIIFFFVLGFLITLFYVRWSSLEAIRKADVAAELEDANEDLQSISDTSVNANTSQQDIPKTQTQRAYQQFNAQERKSYWENQL